MEVGGTDVDVAVGEVGGAAVEVLDEVGEGRVGDWVTFPVSSYDGFPLCLEVGGGDFSSLVVVGHCEGVGGGEGE